MWLWLRKKLPKSFFVWSKLLAYVSGLHGVLLFVLFFMYKGDNQTLSFTLNRYIDATSPVVFLPLQKRVNSARVPTANAVSKPVSSVPVRETKEETVAKLDKKISKNNADKTTMLAAVSSPKKKAKPKNKKEPKVAACKKEEPIVEKKEEAKKEIAPEIKKEQNEVAHITPVIQQAPLENVQYLGQLDLQALEMQEAINGEVGQHWSPPPGISKNAVCEMNVIVGWDGTVHFTVKKSSGIAMYDVSARSAMLKASFPKQLWGKEFLIAFKQ